MAISCILRSMWHTSEQRSPFPNATSISKGAESNRRVIVLNKLFMKHITDLMATGNSAKEISGLGIEVTKVKVGSEYNVVNVYWISHGNNPEETVTKVLKRTAGELRQELANLRVMGKIPEIQFVRDRSIASWQAVEAVLATADFGEDYVPKGVINIKSDFGNEGIMTAKQPPEVSNIDNDLPPMRQNVLGLDHAEILRRLSAKMKGIGKAPSCPQKDHNQNIQFEPFNQEAFQEFLLKQKINKERLMKESMREKRFEEVEEFEDENWKHNFEVDDFIEDDEDACTK